MAKYTKEEIEVAYELYKKIGKLSEVSKVTNINRRTLSDNFNKYGFKYEKVVRKTKPLLSEEDLKSAYNQYLSGISSIALAEIYGVNLKTILRGFKQLGLPIRDNKENSRIYNLNENYFELIDLPDKAYWLGFIYADGYVSIRKNGQKVFGMALASKDEEILIKLNECLDSNYKIGRYMTKGDSEYKSVKYSRLVITSDMIVDSLISHGVVENKTNIIQPPTLDKHLVRHFIRGYLDGDGSIIRNKKEYSVSFLGTDTLLSYISNYFLENNLIKRTNKLEKRKENQIVSSVRYGGNIQAQRILDHLYKDTDLFLERKYNIYKELCNRDCRPYRKLDGENSVNL